MIAQILRLVEEHMRIVALWGKLSAQHATHKCLLINTVLNVENI